MSIGDLVKHDSPDVALTRVEVIKAPATLSDKLRVKAPGDSDRHFIEVRYWMPRGDVLPGVGDIGLLAYDDSRGGEPWLIAFSPS